VTFPMIYNGRRQKTLYHMRSNKWKMETKKHHMLYLRAHRRSS